MHSAKLTSLCRRALHRIVGLKLPHAETLEFVAVSWGLVFALSSAVLYGVASVIQATAAQCEPVRGDGANPFVLARLIRRWRFVAGLALDGLGYAAQFAAVRLLLPLFVVQSAVAGSIAVTAVAARWMLRTEIGRRGWCAIACVIGGLTAMGVTAGAESTVHLHQSLHVAVLGASGVLAIVGLAIGRLPKRFSIPGLALVAGLAFGLVAVSTRVITSLSPTALLHDPATYAVALAGLSAFTFYASALQIGAVTTVTGIVVVSETAFPAIIGITLFGDRTRPGFAWLAIGGFLTSVIGAIALARFGDPAFATGCRQPKVRR